MNNAPRITYTPRPDATPESEIAALASVYRCILDSHTKNEKEKGGRHVEHLTSSPSGVNDQRFRKSTQ